MHGRAVCTPQAASSRRVECRRQTVCVVRYSNSGHQLLLPPANWCPIFASRTTQTDRARREEFVALARIVRIVRIVVLVLAAASGIGVVIPAGGGRQHRPSTRSLVVRVGKAVIEPVVKLIRPGGPALIPA